MIMMVNIFQKLWWRSQWLYDTCKVGTGWPRTVQRRKVTKIAWTLKLKSEIPKADKQHIDYLHSSNCELRVNRDWLGMLKCDWYRPMRQVTSCWSMFFADCTVTIPLRLWAGLFQVQPDLWSKCRKSIGNHDRVTKILVSRDYSPRSTFRCQMSKSIGLLLFEPCQMSDQTNFLCVGGGFLYGWHLIKAQSRESKVWIGLDPAPHCPTYRLINVILCVFVVLYLYLKLEVDYKIRSSMHRTTYWMLNVILFGKPQIKKRRPYLVIAQIAIVIAKLSLQLPLAE